MADLLELVRQATVAMQSDSAQHHATVSRASDALARFTSDDLPSALAHASSMAAQELVGRVANALEKAGKDVDGRLEHMLSNVRALTTCPQLTHTLR